MALKDWKKQGKNKWKKKNNEVVIIEDRTKDASKIGGYIVGVYEFDKDNYFEKEIKTKSQAMVFARNYMRTH